MQKLKKRDEFAQELSIVLTAYWQEAFHMNPTRRYFLQGASLAALTSTLPPIAFGQQHPKSQSEVMDDESLSIFDGISPETFEQWIGSSFRLSLKGKQVDTVVLIAVTKIASPETASSPRTPQIVGTKAAVRPSTSSFSLRFRGTQNALSQDTYMLTHDWLGTFPLFLVPSGPGAKQSTYTATFNLLSPSNSNE